MRENVEVGNTIEKGKRRIHSRYRDSNAQNFRNDSHKSNKPISCIVLAHKQWEGRRGSEVNRRDTQMKTMLFMELILKSIKNWVESLNTGKKRNKLAL